MAAGGSVAARGRHCRRSSQADLQPIVNEAIARWAGAGLDAATLAKLTQVQFVISDLPGSYLGEAEGNRDLHRQQCGRLWLVRRSHAGDG